MYLFNKSYSLSELIYLIRLNKDIHICFRFNISKILFLPYAQSKYDEYTEKVKNAFQNWGKLLKKLPYFL